MSYLISREISIDAGHRVPTHGSKCKNVHGHRYRIKAICQAQELIQEGEQQDMVLDFGFLKEEMMRVIDQPCDHGFIMWDEDPLFETFIPDADTGERVVNKILEQGFAEVGHNYTPLGKLYVVPFIPTAEKLAQHWFERLVPRVVERSNSQARLIRVDVHETPNCVASYELVDMHPYDIKNLMIGKEDA